MTSEADALWRVSGRMKHLDAGVAELDLLAVTQRRERHRRRRRIRAGSSGAPVRSANCASTGPMVGVDMRVDHVRDAHALAARRMRCTRPHLRSGRRRPRICPACRIQRDRRRSRGRSNSRAEESWRSMHQDPGSAPLPLAGRPLATRESRRATAARGARSPGEAPRRDPHRRSTVRGRYATYSLPFVSS